MKKKIYYLLCILFIFSGLLFFISEFISILNVTDSIASYYSHNISDLLVPYSVSSYSPLYIYLRVIFYFLALSYFICFYSLFKVENNKINKAIKILSSSACVGLCVVASFYTNGKYQVLHVTGSIFVFVNANAIMIITALKNVITSNKTYKRYCIISTIFGSLCGLFLLTPEQFFLRPIMERLTIYPFIIFQITTGICLIYMEYKKDKALKLETDANNANN